MLVDKRFIAKFIISFLLTLLLLFLAALIFLKEEQLPYSKDILSFVQQRLGTAEECNYSETIDYLYYKDSAWDKNNKFGLYIYSENRDYFELAQNLVNSQGGDWGYVLIPYNIKDRNFDKWHRVFSQLRNKHLIPIIQLWDVDPNKYEVTTKEAAEFLNRFVWPIKERYISVYNEVNDARFWSGSVNPKQYAQVLNYTIDVFKGTNSEFFLLNGAFNISASTSDHYLDAFAYMRRMEEEIPGIFNKLDGWASHPYPQPNFSGHPLAVGRWSVRAYEDELAFLKNTLGIEKNLPVFITETGWAHAEGKNYDPSYYGVESVAEYMKIAYQEVWLPDDKVRAVTPFTIKYEAPFDHFSWVNDDNVPYLHYEAIRAMQKPAGNPPYYDAASVKISGCDE